jgi:hypothetical protein
MKLFATTAMQDPGVATYLPLFTDMARRDRFGIHTLSEDAAAADMILFLDGHQHYKDLELNAIRRHPLVMQYREKAFVYSEVDQPWCAMPGLYVAMPKSAFDSRRQRACAYLTVPNSHVIPTPPPTGDDALLFSFMGRGGNPAREGVLRQKHPRAIVEDTSLVNYFGDQTAEIERGKRRYAEVIARSKFVLCPRGAGTSSFRVFETMAAGRVPVIVSDEWVPPAGPVWDECAVFIPEAQIDRVGAILESHEARFPAMAAAARRAWEDWFAQDALFHRMTEALADIIRTRTIPESVLCRKITARYVRMRLRAAKGQLRDWLRPTRSESPAPALSSQRQSIVSNTRS